MPALEGGIITPVKGLLCWAHRSGPKLPQPHLRVLGPHHDVALLIHIAAEHGAVVA